MREILFRGKYSKKSPDWIEGGFHKDEDANICEISYRYYKKEGETKAGIWVYGVVVPETVGQYTGVTDKNGKKIFEGDICEVTTFTYDGVDIQLLGEVCFKCCSFVFQDLKHPNIEVLFSSVCDFDTDVEVIGNIYDNPELIGGEANG
ncbi:MAG: hypothetical protein J6L61_04845 [Ruminiclostridium sp.]|nr:hypothetical protein [Ruminiclostridium sp.]